MIQMDGFQSTRPLRGETLVFNVETHKSMTFNPLAPFGARRPIVVDDYHPETFQSTRPLRGETCISLWSLIFVIFQSTRPLRGETPCPMPAAQRMTFQSTRPLRGETHEVGITKPGFNLSIHSPLAGRDMLLTP